MAVSLKSPLIIDAASSGANEDKVLFARSLTIIKQQTPLLIVNEFILGSGLKDVNAREEGQGSLSHSDLHGKQNGGRTACRGIRK